MGLGLGPLRAERRSVFAGQHLPVSMCRWAVRSDRRSANDNPRHGSVRGADRTVRRPHQSRRSEDRVFVVLRGRPRPRSGRRRGVVRRDRARRMVGQLGPSGSSVASTLSSISMQFVSWSLLFLRCLRSLSFMLPPRVCRGGRTSSSGAQVFSSRNVFRGGSSSGAKKQRGLQTTGLRRRPAPPVHLEQPGSPFPEGGRGVDGRSNWYRDRSSGRVSDETDFFDLESSGRSSRWGAV